MIYADMNEEVTQWEQWKADWVLSHLQYIPFSEFERESIRAEFYQVMTSERLNELYQLVNLNLPEPIANGLSYNQGDIHRRLDNLIKDDKK